MTGGEFITALDLPAAACVDRRVPKTMLSEHGAPTAADKRHISNEIAEIHWVAALKSTNIGVAAYRDGTREYLEIAVLRVVLKTAGKADRLTELIHRAIPYPLVAVTEIDDQVNLSLAHKRWSQGEAGKMVLDGELLAVDIPGDGDPHAGELSAALALSAQPRGSLLTVYQGWMDVLLALEVARRTGRFEIPVAADKLFARRNALQECSRLEMEMARLRTAASKEKQMARQVQLNLELKRAEAARAAALARL